MPVTFLQVPGSSPVTFSDLPVRVPLISFALLDRLTPTFLASAFGFDLQKVSYCCEPIYSSPVTFLQLPGSFPVTNSDLPTPVPVNALSFNVL